MKKLCFVKKNTRGSAIVMALVTMTLLVCLGLALIVVSMGNLDVTAADAANNDAYYAAASGVNSAIDQLKFEVSNYYNEMLKAQGTTYTQLYNDFFAGINSNAQSRFTEPSVSGVTTATTFTQGAFDSAENTCQFLVSCTSTAAKNMRYKVNGSVTIKRIDVNAVGAWNFPDRAITAGGALNLGNTNGMNVSGGNVDVANIIRKETDQLKLSEGQLIIDPNVGQTLRDSLKYMSYTDPSITSPDIHITQNNLVIKNVSVSPVMMTSDSGISVSFDGCIIPSGTIYIKGNIDITGGSCNANIYCDGNITASNFTMNGDLYCRGNLNISEVTMVGKTTCDGYVSAYKGSFKGTVYAGNGISVDNASSMGSLFSPETITISHVNISNGIIYSSTKINFGDCSTTCLLFSGGDIELTGGASMCGSLTAMGNIYGSYDSRLWLTLSYSKSNLESIFTDPDNTFFTSGPKPSLFDVVVNQDVRPAGSI